MQKETRNAIERATQRARHILENDFAEQLQGDHDIMLDGRVGDTAGAHLLGSQKSLRVRIVAAVQHKRMAGMAPREAVADYLRDAAFTTLNRFVALKMLEARGLVQECISRGDASSGFVNEYLAFAPGAKFADGRGYRLYIESIFDELSTEVKVLFDRRDPAAALWPRRATFEELLTVLNAPDLQQVWAEDETIGWVYQYFNSGDERRKMREDSQAPRNSRELAIRNQFFTPLYVVQFLSDNTLGRIWYEMRKGDTRLGEVCEYMINQESEAFADDVAPTGGNDRGITYRSAKDPRDLRVIDPACGSGHFLLYCFSLLLIIYEEAWKAEDAPASELTGKSLHEDYLDIDDLRKAVPALILGHNLHGVDIDPRCAQIAQLALWMRAQRAYQDLGIAASDRPIIRRSNIVIAEPMPGDAELVNEFAATLNPPVLGHMFKEIVDEMTLAGEMGTLLPIEKRIDSSIKEARKAFVDQQRLSQDFFPGMAPEPQQSEIDFSGIDDDGFFEQAEDKIFASLKIFSANAADGVGARRRLFADDAEQGIALIDLLRKRFDIVLMNPPFGEPVLGRAQGSFKNLYASFICRAGELLSPVGLCGCITDNTYLKQPSYYALREILLHSTPARIISDLGAGVLDANVQTAAMVFGMASSRDFLLGSATNPDTRAINLKSISNYQLRSMVETAQLPKQILSLGYGPTEARELAGLNPLKQYAKLPWGCGANNSTRLFRLRWEVSYDDIPETWRLITNGGSYSPFYRENYLVCRVRLGQHEAFDIPDESGGKLWDASARQYIGRAGITFPKRSDYLHASVLAPGLVVTPEGKGVFFNEVDLEIALGLMNSSFFGLMASFICGPHKQKGDVELLPLPRLNPQLECQVQEAARAAHDAVLALHRTSETSIHFVLPRMAWPNASAIGREQTVGAVSSCIDKIDNLVRSAVPESLSAEIRLYATEVAERLKDAWQHDVDEYGELLSWAVGVVFGRFDASYATGEREMPRAPNALEHPIPISPAEKSSQHQRFMVLVDDEGHPDDLPNRMASLLETVPSLAGKHLDGQAVRKWLAENFFAQHVATYSKGRRKAPIWWQLSTPNRSYSLWLSAEALTSDTFFRVRSDYLEPKLKHERLQLETLIAEGGTTPGAKVDAAIEQQRLLIAEIAALLEEVSIVAPLWKAHRDDGVMINFAPLWRMFHGNRAWQKELLREWEALRSGHYDWSSWAMHLWPERVVPKCAVDQSLAIAHGLKNEFWFEDEKGKWKPRKAPLHPLEELVGLRTSSAVKDALNKLLEAPGPVAPGKRKRKSRAA